MCQHQHGMQTCLSLGKAGCASRRCSAAGAQGPLRLRCGRCVQATSSRAAVPGMAAGATWMTGNVLSILAVTNPGVGLAVAMPIMQAREVPCGDSPAARAPPARLRRRPASGGRPCALLTAARPAPATLCSLFSAVRPVCGGAVGHFPVPRGPGAAHAGAILGLGADPRGRRGAAGGRQGWRLNGVAGPAVRPGLRMLCLR